MINVNTFDINDPRRAKWVAICEKQAEAYEALQGGKTPIVGNSYDVWNTLGIPWSIYNYYHELGWSDEDIKKHRDNLYSITNYIRRTLEHIRRSLKTQYGISRGIK